MARVTIDATKNNKQTYTDKNVNVKYDNTIKTLKKWTIENFYFNHNVVAYLHPETEYTTKLDDSIKCNEAVYKKAEFDTALSHLMYICLAIGKTMEETERIEAINELCQSVKNDSAL